jgi:hypothetical protein
MGMPREERSVPAVWVVVRIEFDVTVEVASDPWAAVRVTVLAV